MLSTIRAQFQKPRLWPFKAFHLEVGLKGSFSYESSDLKRRIFLIYMSGMYFFMESIVIPLMRES